MRRSLVALILCLAMLPDIARAESLPRLRSGDGKLLDTSNRSVLLRGVNVGKKGAPFLPERGEEDYAALERWGLNCVRLYINWAGIEPEPGHYDDALLTRLDQHIAWANTHGIYVLIDLHQDLYSEAVPGGNGAPAWATLDDGQPHEMPGGPWSVAYFTSPKVHRAFDSLWQNRPGPEGVGLQDRYAAMARHVAERYADNPGVVGIDIINEPALGSDITKVLPALLAASPKLAAIPDMPAGILADMASPDGMAKFVGYCERKEFYLWATEAITPVLQRFEAEKLQPFYDRVGQAIRSVASETLLFFEPPVLANAGAQSALQLLKDGEGKPLPQQVYAPHVYDLVTDSPDVDKPSPMRIEIMFQRVAQRTQSLGLPTIIGEWGGYYGNAKARPAAQIMTGQFEQYGMGDLYWDYEGDLASTAYFDQLCRPYPVAVSGTLMLWHLDQETKTLTIQWDQPADAKAPTPVYVPKLWYPQQPQAKTMPEAQMTWTEVPGDAGWWLEVNPAGAGTQELTLRP